jgi:Protein of unknown function (DUF4242)
MRLYAILRREGWASQFEAEQAAVRSLAEATERMPDDIHWIRSYILAENEGSLGSVCIYEASSPEAIRQHAALADIPVTEIVGVTETVLIGPDPAD